MTPSATRLDKTDIELLRQLQKNARLSTKELAAAVNLSTTPTFERVRRLEKDGYIRYYTAVLDADRLNCGFVVFCNIRMKQHTYENSMRIMEAVQAIDEIAECYNISGDYDFMLKIHAANMKAYQEFILKILGDLDCIGSLSSSFVLGEVKNSHAVPLPRE